jgi:hypothetical protein
MLISINGANCRPDDAGAGPFLFSFFLFFLLGLFFFLFFLHYYLLIPPYPLQFYNGRGNPEGVPGFFPALKPIYH